MIRKWEISQHFDNSALYPETQPEAEDDMHYPGPRTTDFREVAALNAAFLRLLGSDEGADQLLAGVATEIGARLCSLDDQAVSRLADAPFLLFSLRETDDDYWDEVNSNAGSYSLFAGSRSECSDRTRLIAASLGYVWQMARQNPYILRLICCASLYWCERIAEQPIMNVINRATATNDLLALRAAGNAGLWRKLLAGGLDRRTNVRTATHHSVLQNLLMRPLRGQGDRWRSAACRTRVPSVSLSADD